MPRRPKTPKLPKEIEFDFIKSNLFRVIRADGAFGGLAPNGVVHMALYSERQPIPTKVVHTVISNTQLGPEIQEKRQGRKAIVREVEVDVTMDVGQAIVLRDWLTDKINQYQQIAGPTPDTKTNGKGGKR
jgi:hypothetical protein